MMGYHKSSGLAVHQAQQLVGTVNTTVAGLQHHIMASSMLRFTVQRWKLSLNWTETFGSLSCSQ